jgi:hypothetical protein
MDELVAWMERSKIQDRYFASDNGPRSLHSTWLRLLIQLPRKIAMDVKKAVATAKKWILDTLADESISNLGLEEVEFHDSDKTWRITLGFSRPWNSTRNAIVALTGDIAPRRVYRILKVSDETGKVLSMTRRDSDEK